MQLPAEIQKTIIEIYNKTSPETIFLYGSHARGDFIKESDYEIGILYKSEQRVRREDLAAMHSIQNLHLYSFPLQEFILYDVQIPFTRAIYFRELLEKGAITVLGKSILENMKPPHILMSDILEELSFDKARALSAMLSFRRNDMYSASDHLIKSCLYASKMYLLLEKGTFISRYDEILKHIQASSIEQNYLLLIEYVLQIRSKKIPLDLKKIYENISYSESVFRQAEKKFKNENDITVI